MIDVELGILQKVLQSGKDKTYELNTKEQIFSLYQICLDRTLSLHFSVLLFLINQVLQALNQDYQTQLLKTMHRCCFHWLSQHWYLRIV